MGTTEILFERVDAVGGAWPSDGEEIPAWEFTPAIVVSPPPARRGRAFRVGAAIAILEGLALVAIVGLVSGKIAVRSGNGSRPASAGLSAGSHAGSDAAAPRAAASHPARSLQAGSLPPRSHPGDAHTVAVSPYPNIPAMERAAAYLQARAGRTAFAVVDTRGREYGLNMHEHFVSASVTKAMLLVAYLRALDAHKGTLGPTSQALLYPMVHVSDNHAASAVWRIVGNAGLQSVADRAAMTDFTLGVDWANEEISAADQARFFYRINSMIPRRFRAYARSLLANIDPTESWGVPAAARPAWHVFFKGGWRRTGEGQLVSQAGELERGRQRIAIAVMTVADPSMGYGEETIDGATARLLGK